MMMMMKKVTGYTMISIWMSETQLLVQLQPVIYIYLHIYIYEKPSEIDVEKPNANRFASLADSDVQFKRTDNNGKIFDYLHEKRMMKVTTQSPIKKVPAKPRQKNFEKAHKTKTKKKSTQTAEKGNIKLEDTSTKKKPDKLIQTKVIPNAKGNNRKIQSLKEKIAKLQRELQSYVNLMKPRKLNLRKISKNRRLTKRSLRTLRSRKRKSPRLKVTRSKDQQNAPIERAQKSAKISAFKTGSTVIYALIYNISLISIIRTKSTNNDKYNSLQCLSQMINNSEQSHIFDVYLLYQSIIQQYILFK
ncbi:Hypothetical_protein [Hexamita inflata]|uniref:Hypothetical_protein n=1 Tax=Hexamita inflata TaxID=28002 RepID=A0AA86QLS6_9EUKA|nr:Hypothetical protein HINF_LOCUS43134 [Hexamita inflata]